MRRRQRGVVLVIALAILGGLVALVATLVASQQIALRAEANRINSGRAVLAAQAGAQRALAALADTIQNTSAAATGTTAASTTVQGQAQMQTDEWYTLGDKGNDRFVVGGSSFRLEIVDAGGFVNLNTALEAQLDLLPLTTEQVAAILDWREAATTSTRAEGAKDDYYQGLTKPYNAKLRRFDGVDELLDVRYFTPADVWQITTNTTGTGNTALPALADGREPVLADLLTADSYVPQLAPGGGAMVNINTQNVNGRLLQAGISRPLADQLAPTNPPGQTPRFADLGAVLAAAPSASAADRAAILDNVTTSAATRVEGKINLNTASEAVLMSLPNMTQDLAQAIVAYQSTGFTKLSDLLQVSGFNDANTLRQFAGYFTVRSSVFLVRVVGECNGTRAALEFVVDTSTGTPQIAKMHDQPYTDMPTRWGWSADATNETVLVEAK